VFAPVWDIYNHFPPLYTTFLYISTLICDLLLKKQKKYKKNKKILKNLATFRPALPLFG